MNKLLTFIRWYTNHRAIAALLALVLVLEIIFVVRIADPSFFRLILDNHIFELVVLLVLAQVILLLFRLLERAPGRICRDEHECHILLKDVLREEPRAASLHVFSAGLASRLDMLTSIQNDRNGTLLIQVLAQSPDQAPDRADAKRMKYSLSILERDHRDLPIEVRFFEVAATIRALVLCDRNHRPFWGVVSWYRYEKTSGKVRVVGRSNPAIVMRADDSAEDRTMLTFIMDVFTKNWEDSKERVAFPKSVD